MCLGRFWPASRIYKCYSYTILCWMFKIPSYSAAMWRPTREGTRFLVPNMKAWNCALANLRGRYSQIVWKWRDRWALSIFALRLRAEFGTRDWLLDTFLISSYLILWNLDPYICLHLRLLSWISISFGLLFPLYEYFCQIEIGLAITISYAWTQNIHSVIWNGIIFHTKKYKEATFCGLSYKSVKILSS